MDRRQFIYITGAAAASAAMVGPISHASDNPAIETDLLIIGSGFAGLWAAISAVDGGVRRIAIVDKGSIGRSSQSKFAAGATIYCEPADDQDAWLREFAGVQGFLSRQDMLEDMLATSYSRYQKLTGWGVSYYSTPLGPERLSSRGLNGIKMRVIPRWKDKIGGAAVVGALTEQVEARRVAFHPKIMVTALLKKNSRVAGAVGVSRVTGESVVFKSRAVILAAADCSFRGNYACCDQVTGDAFRLAYDVGVRLNNCEFLNINTGSPRYGFEGTGISAGFGAKFLTADFRQFMKEYHPDADRAEVCHIVQAMAAEVVKGNGPPFYFDMSNPIRGKILIRNSLLHMGGWMPLNLRRLEEVGSPIFAKPQEWLPVVQSLRGGVRTDIDCMSDLPGLFAAGLSQAMDPGLFNGWSSMRAMWSGERSGKSAAQFLANVDDISPDQDDIQACKEAEMKLQFGTTGMRPGTVSEHIQGILFPYKTCIRKTDARLRAALAEIEAVRDNEVPALFASDPHELIKAHEAANMTLVAELFLRSSLDRKESRGDHFREDYPSTDNVNFLKWVTVKKDAAGKVETSFEPVPLDTYPVRPGAGRSS